MCELCSDDPKIKENGRKDLMRWAIRFREFATHLEMMAAFQVHPHHGNKSTANLVASLIRYLATDWL